MANAGHDDSLFTRQELEDELTDEINALKETWQELLSSAFKCLGDFIDSQFRDINTFERYQRICEEANNIKTTLDDLLKDRITII